jgi:hypothetical protein
MYRPESRSRQSGGSGQRKDRAIRLIGAAAALWWILILVATLTPLPGQAPRSALTPPLCLVCGETGTVDVILNVALFLPLGLLLRLLGWRRALVVGCGVITTVVVETAQLLVIPGRDASPSDVITNSAGTVIGMALAENGPSLVAPTAAAALRLAIAAVGLPALVLAGTAWLLVPAPPASLWYGQHAPDLGMYEQFRGTILGATLGGHGMPVGPLRSSPELRQAFLADGPSLAALFVAGPKPPGPAPIVSVFDEQRRKVILLGQGGRWLYFETRMRSDDLRFRTLSFTVPSMPVPVVGDTLRMLGRVQAGRVHVTVTGPMGTVVDRYSLSPGLGWALVSPMPRPVGRDAPVLSMLWVAMLWVPFGYYTRASVGRQVGDGGTERRRDGGVAPAAVLAAAAATAAGIGLLVAPMMSEMPIPGPAEWLGLAAGILFGAILSGVVRRLSAAERIP